ncbi:MAG: hypothetical protein COA79_12680 [Planctomycetota bacterium]|nr:MAG: hypothetical protein COA79_12680 [Planctomycetota bacterium]
MNEKKLNALIIDSESLIGDVISAIVKRSGHQAEYAGTMVDALIKVQEPFELLFIQDQFLGADIDILVKSAREHFNPLIIILSLEISDKSERNSLRLGAYSTLYKPISPDDVTEVLNDCLLIPHNVQDAFDIPELPKLIIVDDDEDVLASIKYALKRYDVVATTSPLKALKEIARTNFHILLTDIMMDEMNGINLIHNAKSIRPTISAIVLTGFANKKYAMEALKEGAHDLLEKPLLPKVITGAVERLWETKRLELEKENLLKEIKEQNKALVSLNNELERFAYISSHDLKSPLENIISLISWILEDTGTHLSEESADHLIMINSRVNRLKALINDLYEYVKVGKHNYRVESINVADMIKDCVDILNIPNGFKVEYSEVLPVFEGKKQLFYHVICNLISNSIKHHDHPESGLLSIEYQVSGDFYHFSFSDNGPGVEPRFHEKIFIMFESLKSRDTVEGSGLGLSMIKKIIEEEGGRISINSDLGQGSKFEFTWPILNNDKK